jgi:hypothetical protein
MEGFLRENAEQQRKKTKRSKPPICVIHRLTILESQAHRLGLFPPQLCRKVAQFEMLLEAVGKNVVTDTLDTEKAKAALVQLEEVLLLADDILHSLQPLI